MRKVKSKEVASKSKEQGGARQELQCLDTGRKCRQAARRNIPEHTYLPDLTIYSPLITHHL